MLNYSELSDQQLTTAIVESDTEAFKALYYRYYQKLYHFIYYRTRSQVLTQDLSQELFVRFWNNRAALNPQKSIKAYLYRIAHNLVINYMQRQKLERNYKSSLSEKHFITSIKEEFDIKDIVNTAIDNLPEKSRTVFILSRFEDFSYKEIAQSLEISIKTVEKRMSLALKILRDKLGCLYR